MVSIDVLTAVHHPVRRRIFDHLVTHGPTQVGTLARGLGQQVGSVSHHLRMLERAGVVERAPELATDGRTSWWRASLDTLRWSVDDYADRPADRARAQVAERLNVEHQVAKLVDWKRRNAAYDEEWRRAAFSNDSLTLATSEELADLQEALTTTVRLWREAIDTDDGQEREPVFVFQHGFPTQT
jgi:DNA-binding transcriptional ArsR family regulator